MQIHPTLSAHRMVWSRKAALRRVYEDFHRRLLEACPDDPVLEVGGGSGHLKQAAARPDLISIDILPSPWIDAVADGQRLPFADRSLGGIVMLDVLHHLPRPARFFEESARVLRAGGRLAMIEPGITPVSGFFYRMFHQEPVDLHADPLAGPAENTPADPFDSNQAIPTLLFTKRVHLGAFQERFPTFRLVRRDWLSLFAYPLSGGFKAWTLIPARAVGPMLRLERHLLPGLGPVMAFRLFVVLERACPPARS